MADPIRVLQVNTRSDVGGGAQAFTDWIEEFDPARVTVVGVAPDQEPWFPRLRAHLGDRAYALPIRSLRPDLVPRLLHLIKRYRIQLVHTHGKAAGLHGRLAAYLSGLPVVHHVHGLALDHLSSPVRKTYLRIERWLSRRTNCVINVSAGERAAALAHRLYPEGQSRIIPYGMRLDRFKLARLHGEDRPETPPVVLSVARLAYQKGPDVALRVMRHVVDRIPEAQLRWVGDGELRRSTLRQVRDLGLSDHVDLPGVRHDIPDTLAEAEVYLTTARWEGLPIAVLEAMSAGLPVVGSHVVGNDGAIADGVTGFLRPLAEEAALAAAVLRLLNNRDLARQMGRAGRDRVEREFALGPVTRRLEDLYVEILGR
jgi:glycosyltransferase involved in cell wall biosynthesis